MGRERHLLRTAVGIGAEDPPQWSALLERWRADQENSNIYRPVSPLDQATLNQLYDARGHPVNDAVRKSNDEQADAANMCTNIARKHNVVVGDSPSRGVDDESISSGSLDSMFDLDDSSDYVEPLSKTTRLISKYDMEIQMVFALIRGAFVNWNKGLRFRMLACPSRYDEASFAEECVREYRLLGATPFFTAGLSAQVPMKRLCTILSSNMQDLLGPASISWSIWDSVRRLFDGYGFLCWNWSIIQRLALVPCVSYFPIPGLRLSNNGESWAVPRLTLDNYILPFDALAVTAVVYTAAEAFQGMLKHALMTGLNSPDRMAKPLLVLDAHFFELKRYLAPLSFSNSLRSWAEIQLHRFNHFCYSTTSLLGWEGRSIPGYSMRRGFISWQPCITLAGLTAHFMTTIAFRKATSFAVRYLAKAFLSANTLDLTEPGRMVASSLGSTTPVFLRAFSASNRSYHLTYRSKIGLSFGIEAVTNLLWWSAVASVNLEIGRRCFGWLRDVEALSRRRRSSSPEPMEID